MSIFSRLILSLFILSVFCKKCSPVLAQTTIYTGNLEKNLDSGEIKLTIPAGTETAIKSIKSDGSSSVVYVHADHLGSTALITDNSGSQIASIQYYPYGATYNLQPTTYNLQPTTDRLYTNQRQDKDTDLYFYNARYYNPAIGRFLSADKAEGPNRYAYVSNNPIMRNDPSGNREVRDDQDKRLAYKKTFYPWNGISVQPDNPQYRAQYQKLLSEFESIQDTANSTLDLVNKGVNFIYNRNHYNNELISSWDKQAKANYRLNKTTQSLDDFSSNMDTDSEYDIKKEYRIMRDVNVYKSFLANADEDENEAWRHYDNNPELIERLDNGLAVCGDFAAAAQLLFNQNGLTTHYQLVKFYENDGSLFYHANLYGNINGIGYVIDPTWNLVMPKDEYVSYISSIYSLDTHIVMSGITLAKPRMGVN